MEELIRQKIRTIEGMEKIIEETTNFRMLVALKTEIYHLKDLIHIYKADMQSKKVIYIQNAENKQKYFLEDGSYYVVGSKFKYLYNSKDGSVTYQFSNGQFEKTLACGIKEIRYPDGSIIIKMNDKKQETIKE